MSNHPSQANMKNTCKQISTLQNGVTIATDNIPQSSSVSIGLWLPIGSGIEIAENNGLCHFYEHLVFKGTKNRSAFKIASEIEDLGGDINAYTSREATCFYVKIAKEHFESAILVLADLVGSPKLLNADFEKEKSVILEEIRAAEDSPEDVADDLFHKTHFKGSGFALPIAGTIKSVKNLQLSSVKKHQKFILEELPILVSVAGSVEHNKVVDILNSPLIAARFNYKTSASPRIFRPQGWRRECVFSSSDVFLHRPFSQATAILGTFRENLSAGEARALQIFNHIFGGGFTSRLFQNIREKYGLVYSINSSVENSLLRSPEKKISSLFQIFFATDKANLEKVRDLVQKELAKFQKNGFSKNELARAKQGMIGAYKLSQDSISSRQNHLARQVLRYGHPINSSKTEQEIQNIQGEFIEEFINGFIKNSHWTFAAAVPK